MAVALFLLIMPQSILKIAIIPGALEGIGPRLFIESLKAYGSHDTIQFFWCGNGWSLSVACDSACEKVSFLDDNYARLESGPRLRFYDDIPLKSPLEDQANFLKKGVDLAHHGLVHALVTGPVEKACLKFLDDASYPGQTEYLSKLLAQENQKPMMAFMGGPFLMSLVTTHLPIKSVASALNSDMLLQHLEAVALHGERVLDKKKESLKIAVLGLNPHAGEQGLIGTEEQDLFVPALDTMRHKGINVIGPLPADGFFAYWHRMTAAKLPDIVVAIYHDQGLIPYKLLAKGQAVNVTLGLRIPRTSPAHGTAFAAAKEDTACHLSTAKAIEIAIALATKSERMANEGVR